MLILLANCNWQVICRVAKANHFSFRMSTINLMYSFVFLNSQKHSPKEIDFLGQDKFLYDNDLLTMMY